MIGQLVLCQSCLFPPTVAGDYPVTFKKNKLCECDLPEYCRITQINQHPDLRGFFEGLVEILSFIHFHIDECVVLFVKLAEYALDRLIKR